MSGSAKPSRSISGVLWIFENLHQLPHTAFPPPGLQSFSLAKYQVLDPHTLIDIIHLVEVDHMLTLYNTKVHIAQGITLLILQLLIMLV